MLEGEVACVRDAPLEPLQQSIYEGSFGAEPCEQREVNVDGQARFTPALKREAPDEAEAPLLSPAENLELLRRAKNIKNGVPPS